MATYASSASAGDAMYYPVDVDVTTRLTGRSRLTAAFRVLLAIPHLILVGWPTAAILSWSTRAESGNHDWTVSGGILGAVAVAVAVVAWIVILLTRRYPETLRRYATFYLRWRVRAGAYVTLLTDDYPPFGDGDYPARLELGPMPEEHDRMSVVFRLLLALPHLVLLWAVGLVWLITTIVAWFSIVFTGTVSPGIHRFGVGALRWTTRVEAYLLLLYDAYPPFTIGR